MRQSYTIVDSSGQKVGVLFMDIEPHPAGLLQSVARSAFDEPAPQVEHIERRNVWASDGITYTIAGLFSGGVVLAYAWAYDLDGGIWVAGIALLSGLGLHILKIILHRPYNPSPTQPAAGKHIIAVEIHEPQGNNVHTTLDEIQDDTITIDELRRVAAAWTDGVSFARAPMCKAAKVSQGKFRKIKNEFEQLNLCYTDKGNRTHLTLRGRALLRKLARQ